MAATIRSINRRAIQSVRSGATATRGILWVGPPQTLFHPVEVAWVTHFVMDRQSIYFFRGAQYQRGSLQQPCAAACPQGNTIGPACWPQRTHQTTKASSAQPFACICVHSRLNPQSCRFQPRMNTNEHEWNSQWRGLRFPMKCAIKFPTKFETKFETKLTDL
jgi:hypothetical protein